MTLSLRIRLLFAAALAVAVTGPAAVPAGATQSLSGTFELTRAATFGSKYMNVGMAGSAVSGTLRGWHVRMSAYQAGDCLVDCAWYDFRFQLTRGHDIIYGGCYRFPDGFCRGGGINLYTGEVDERGGVAGGGGSFAGAAGNMQLHGYLVPADVEGNAEEQAGEVRFVVQLS